MKRLIYLAIVCFIVPWNSFSQEISLKGKELFGDIKARHIGPALMSGRINDIEMHPTNTRVMYIGAAGGGVRQRLRSAQRLLKRALIRGRCRIRGRCIIRALTR